MKRLMGILKCDWYLLLMVAAGFVLGTVFYARMPAAVPIHWNEAGQANGYGPRWMAAFLQPLMMLGLYLLLAVVPLIDPRAENYARFRGAYQIIKIATLSMMLIMEGFILLATVGIGVNMAIVSGVAIGALFIVLGCVMSRIKHNYFVGIRTPWTLADENVWAKTHRMAGPLWVLGGAAILISSPFGFTGFLPVCLIAAAVCALVPMVYSYLVFRKSGGRN